MGGPEWRSAIFPNVKDSQYEDIGIRNFVANFIVTHYDSAHFAGLESREPRSQPRMRGNALCTRDQLANDLNGGRDINGMKKLVEADQIRACTARPPKGHRLTTRA